MYVNTLGPQALTNFSATKNCHGVTISLGWRTSGGR